jgi:hypothetical protein
VTASTALQGRGNPGEQAADDEVVEVIEKPGLREPAELVEDRERRADGEHCRPEPEIGRRIETPGAARQPPDRIEDQIELHLDRDGPEGAVRAQEGEMLGEDGRRPNPVGPARHGGPDGDAQRDHREVERRHPSQPGKDVAEGGRPVGCLRQVKARHQEAAQHEEEHHTELPRALAEPRRQVAGVRAVRDEDDEDREAAQAGQGGDALWPEPGYDDGDRLETAADPLGDRVPDSARFPDQDLSLRSPVAPRHLATESVNAALGCPCQTSAAWRMAGRRKA